MSIAILLFVAAWVGPVALLYRAAIRAPEGWQDAAGWHAGRDPRDELAGHGEAVGLGRGVERLDIHEGQL